jgi:hypothetical protein
LTGESVPGLEEGETVWLWGAFEPGKFSKFRVKELAKGVTITLGKVKNSDHWKIQN